MSDIKELTAYKDRFEQELFNILDYWMKYDVERDADGFYGAVDLKNKPVIDAPKSCVLNARILWTFSEAAGMYPGKGYGEMADRALRVLEKYFWDKGSGGYFMQVSSSISMLDATKPTGCGLRVTSCGLRVAGCGLILISPFTF